MNAGIENTIKQCATCLEYQQTLLEEQAVLYAVPYKMWEMVGTDTFLLKIKHLCAL